MLKWCSRRVLTVIVIMYFIWVRKGILLMFLGRISQRSANWGLQVWTFFYSLSNSNCKSVKKEQILKQSCFCDNHIVQNDSPDRLNIKIYVKCVKKNNSDISDYFQRENAHWIVIFCEGIKDYDVVHTMFRRKCDAYLVQMFHRKTAEHIKETFALIWSQYMKMAK